MPVMSEAPMTALLERVWQQLGRIDDPEMPISIVDLGIVDDVRLIAGGVCVRITPTFTGCPALDLIDRQIESELRQLPGIERVCVEHVFDPPWGVARISPAGRARLKGHGVTVPQRKWVQLSIARRETVNCPFCESIDTRLDSPFGPTRCRMIYYCQACHNTFEHLKAV